MMQDAPQFSSRDAHICICICLKRLRYCAYSLPMILRHALCVVLVVSATAAHADPTDDFITAQMRSQNIPGISLAIIKDGKIVKVAGLWTGGHRRQSRRDA